MIHDPGVPHATNSRLAYVPLFAGWFALALGAIVLGSWLLRMEPFDGLERGWVTMKPNTAAGLMLAGLALLLASGRTTRARRITSAIIGSLVSILGLFTLGERVYRIHGGIDDLLLNSLVPDIAAQKIPRMSTATALCFLLLGIAVAALGSASPGIRRVARAFAFAVLTIGLFDTVDYLFAAQTTYAVASVTLMGTHTALTFVLLAVGAVLVGQDSPIALLLAADTAGGATMRRLLPAATALPVLLGAVRLVGERNHWYPAGFGVALFAVTAIVLLDLLVIWASRHLHAADLRIRKQQQNLLVTNEMLVTNARELATKNEVLEQRTAELLAASAYKSQFLANMSHELRTPLNAIIGFADLLQSGEVRRDAPEHDEFLGDILISGRHLLRLVDDILDLTRVEAGELSVHAEPVDLSHLAARAASALGPAAAAKGIHIEVTVAPQVPEMTTDPDRLAQVLYNFLSNAVKFSARGATVWLRIQPEDAEHVRFEVEDHGIGIAAADLPRLFRPFAQLSEGAAKEHQGTGLGLALSKHLVELLGGRVGLTSTRGVGSVFFAVLPRNAAVLG